MNQEIDEQFDEISNPQSTWIWIAAPILACLASLGVVYILLRSPLPKPTDPDAENLVATERHGVRPASKPRESTIASPASDPLEIDSNTSQKEISITPREPTIKEVRKPRIFGILFFDAVPRIPIVQNRDDLPLLEKYIYGIPSESIAAKNKLNSRLEFVAAGSYSELQETIANGKDQDDWPMRIQILRGTESKRVGWTLYKFFRLLRIETIDAESGKPWGSIPRAKIGGAYLSVKIGDKVALFDSGDYVMSPNSLTEFRELNAKRRTKDWREVKAAPDWLPSGTRVEVIALDYPSNTQINESLAVRVRSLDFGTPYDEFWVSLEDLREITPDPEKINLPDPDKAKVEQDKAKVEQETKEKNKKTRAKSDLFAADNLARRGKSDEALKLYRKIVKDYPGTQEAQQATKIIKVMTGRP